MRFDPIRRRLFLTGAGAALALPWLPSLLPRDWRRKVEAQPTTVPKRFIAIKSYNGAPVLDWYPRQPPAGLSTHSVDGTVALSQELQDPTGRHSDGNQYFAHQAPLSDFATTGISNIFGTGFNPFHEYMLLLRGLDIMPNLNHNHGGFLGNLGLRTNGVGGALPGAQINATIDQVMARSAAVYPRAPAGPRVLHLGSRTNTCSYAPTDPNNVLATGMGAVNRAQAYTDPRVAFDATLSSIMPMMPSDTPSEPPLSSRLIDRVYADYERARDSGNLSAADRQVLMRHMTYLSELEARMEAPLPPPAVCDTSNRPSSLDSGGEFDVSVSTIEQFFDLMVDLTVLALSCDVTRIVTLDVTKMVIDDSGDIFGMGDSENPDAAGRNNWHLQAHNWDDNAIRWLGQGQAWIADRVVTRLLSGLHSVMQGDGESLLHHSLVLWGNELSFNHLNYSLPTAVFGRAGGAIRSGRYVDFIDHNRPIRFRQHDGSVVEGVQYNRLLVTMMQAMGLSPSEYETTPGQGFGELSPIEKGDGFALDYDSSNVNQPLPSLLA